MSPSILSLTHVMLFLAVHALFAYTHALALEESLQIRKELELFCARQRGDHGLHDRSDGDILDLDVSSCLVS